MKKGTKIPSEIKTICGDCICTLGMFTCARARDSKQATLLRHQELFLGKHVDIAMLSFVRPLCGEKKVRRDCKMNFMFVGRKADRKSRFPLTCTVCKGMIREFPF